MPTLWALVSTGHRKTFQPLWVLGLTTALADRYRIERELGTGGMATVYLARDLKHDRDVAIKVLHRDLAESLGKERFLREIRLAAALTHPHILPLFDSGDAGGRMYYVMPSAEGQSLRDQLDEMGQLPVDDAGHGLISGWSESDAALAARVWADAAPAVRAATQPPDWSGSRPCRPMNRSNSSIA